MFRVVSFPPIGTCFQHTEWYFTQMCALKILKTLIWLPLYICPKSPFSNLSSVKGKCISSFLCHPSGSSQGSSGQWVAVQSANKHLTSFSLHLLAFPGILTHFGLLKSFWRLLGRLDLSLSLSPKWLKQRNTYLSSLYIYLHCTGVVKCNCDITQTKGL